ncbi:MAG: AAA family ATPase [Polyangia bacterium]
MDGLGDLIGHPRVVAILEEAIRARKVHHAYLFEGPAGVGKGTAAVALALALNCKVDPMGCGRCESCEKILSGHHPDVIQFDMTPKGLTDRVRDLLGRFGYAPHEGKARVIILDPAHELAQGRAEAANALLKMLEEPPADTYFILVTSEPRRLPVTVRSRAQRLRFAPLPTEAVATILRRQHGVEPQEAARAAAESDGSITTAMEALGQSEESERRHEQLRVLMEAAASPDKRALFGAVAESSEREEAIALCDLLWRLLRDAVVLEVDASRVPADRRARVEALVGRRSSASLTSALAEVEEAKGSLAGNVAPALVLEHLLLALRPMPLLLGLRRGSTYLPHMPKIRGLA